MIKLDTSWDYEKIRQRIELDMAGHKPADWARKVGVRINVVSNVHGKSQRNPSMLYVLAVARATGKPPEWYLYGETPAARPVNPEETRAEGNLDPDLLAKISRILDSEAAEDLRAAVAAILARIAINEQKPADRRIERLEKRIDQLIQRMARQSTPKAKKEVV